MGNCDDRRRLAAAVALGIGTAFAGLLVHRWAWRPGGVMLPWGLLLAVVMVYVVIRAMAIAPGGVRSAAGCAAGWVLFVLLAQRTRPEGDFLILGDSLGMGFVFGGMGAVAVAVVRTVSRAGREKVRP